ncbi:MAG: hypothetical protein ACPLPR_10095 [Bacillota bacterium]
MRKIESKMTNILNAIAEGVISSAEAKQYMAELRQQKATIQEQLAGVDQLPKDLSKATIKEYLRHLREEGGEEIQENLGRYVSHIILYDDRCEVVLIFGYGGVGSGT